MKAKTMNDTQIKFKGIEALNESLGPTAALRFLTLLHKEPTDYVKLSKKLYRKQSIDDIFERAKKNWQG
ncbi:MAG: hypothetical protein MUP30_00050 [Deltaproteobacteria bacterium]|jgi:hypothetical protein|nr:hypothetical protein [Deltaproteobacteria bacterium]